MSLDINWSLLHSPPGHASSSKLPATSSTSSFGTDPNSLSAHLISVLNTALQSAPRPSFIGPISIAQFDFGSTPPEVEIKDVRDVWRAFDDQEDDEEEREKEYSYEEDGYEYGHEDAYAFENGGQEEEYEMISPFEADDGDEVGSIFSGSRRQSISMSVANVGIGIGRMGMGMGLGPGSVYGHPTGNAYRNISSPLPGGGGRRGSGPHAYSHSHTHSHSQSLFSHPLSPSPSNVHRRHTLLSTRHASTQFPHSSPPPAMPRPPPPQPSANSNIPSLQLHLRVNHTSNLTLTLLTSLVVNYPSATFMALPLRLSVVGLELKAEVVMAYTGEKGGRVHLTIVEDDADLHHHQHQGQGSDQEHVYGHGHGHGHGDKASLPIGQRILPNLHIESEIGHADVHVLRNVGKVERFITEVVRKTLVDELVFPNFHTIALG